MNKVEIVKAIVEAIGEKGFTGRDAQKVLIEAAQYGADVHNEKANNMAIALFLNVNDETQKVANRFKKEELTAILIYIDRNVSDNTDLVSEKDEIAESNKEIIETHQYLSEVNRIWNTRRNTNSARFTNLVTGVLYGLGQDVSEVTGNCIKLKGKYVSDLRGILSLEDAKKLYRAVKQYDLTGGAER